MQFSNCFKNQHILSEGTTWSDRYVGIHEIVISTNTATNMVQYFTYPCQSNAKKFVNMDPFGFKF